MKKILLIISLLLSVTLSGQKTWYGEIGVTGGGSSNDIFRYRELVGSGSFTGRGSWTTGVDFRRIITDHFSIEAGLTYSQHYFISRSAPLPEIHEEECSLGMISFPVTARLDFLKYFFIDGGVIAGLQAGMSDNFTEDFSGLGATAGFGVHYKFESDIFISLRAFMSQYSLSGLLSDRNARVLWDSGFRISAGYQFIHLGKCNCPEDNSPRRRFF